MTTKRVLLGLLVPLHAWADPVPEDAWPANDFDCVKQTRDQSEECAVDVSVTLVGIEEIGHGKLTVLRVQVQETRLGRAANELFVRANIPNRAKLEPLSVGGRYDLHLHANDDELYVVHHDEAR